tara:strand:- start:3430 stop:3588 length:159 start_codon:yes stop_codon:yes gene_type:complete
MRKATQNHLLRHEPKCGSRGKKTSIGRGNVGTSTMNKHKKRMRKAKYRGQGK